MQYTPLDEDSNGNGGDDSLVLTVANGDADDSSSPRSRNNNRVPKHLSEPLTSPPKRQEEEDDDPFYVFREDLYRKLELVDEGLTRYLRLVHQTDTAVNTHELKDAKKQLKRHIKNAESTLKDVITTVQLVSSQREKFPNIDNSQLFDRKTLVETSQDRLVLVKGEMNSEAVKHKMLQDERAKTLRRMQLTEDKHEEEEENNSFIADSHAKASLLMQHQDETLDELDEVVTRVGVMAGDIHQEIGMQNKMLNEMDQDLSDAEEKLGLVMGKSTLR